MIKDNKHKCFRGYSSDQCPLHNLEVTKLVYGVLLVIAVATLVSCNLMWHG